MPSGYYADIEDAKRAAEKLDAIKDARAVGAVRRLLDELAKYRSGEPAEDAETVQGDAVQHREG